MTTRLQLRADQDHDNAGNSIPFRTGEPHSYTRDVDSPSNVPAPDGRGGYNVHESRDDVSTADGAKLAAPDGRGGYNALEGRDVGAIADETKLGSPDGRGGYNAHESRNTGAGLNEAKLDQPHTRDGQRYR